MRERRHEDAHQAWLVETEMGVGIEEADDVDVIISYEAKSR